MSTPIDWPPIVLPIITNSITIAFDLAAQAIKNIGLTADQEKAALEKLKLDLDAEVAKAHETTAKFVRDDV